MSRNVTCRLVWNCGYGRMVNYRRINALTFRCISNGNQSLLCSKSAGYSVINRKYSNRQSSTNSTTPTKPVSASLASVDASQILPKINALLSETNKLAADKLANSKIIDSGKSLFRRQWDVFFKWYDEISHTNEVRESHKQVEDLQDKLSQAQHLRRDVSKELNDLRYELQMCYADQANCAKSESRYLELIRREIEISNKEKQKTEEFNLLDKAERDLFILMQSAVKTSHEKEKIHTNSAKYWSIVGSLAGALLGICGTTFSFYNRNGLLADINKEFVVIREDTKVINEKVQLLVNEQRDFLRAQQQRDREQLEREAIANVNASKIDRAVNQGDESWLHWIARKSYVIGIYRYFVPKTVNLGEL